MKKIIIPFPGDHFSEGAFSFARELNSLSPILLTGIFLPEVEYARFFFFPTSYAAPAFVPLPEHFDEEEIENNMQKFSQKCQKTSIEYRVHKNLNDFAIQELIRETRFADAMILGSEKFFREGGEDGPDEHLKDALHNTECPVFIVPEKFNFPSTIILTYDGSESSVYSIKQFASLFPELCNLKTALLHIQEKQKTIPDRLLIEELVARHFNDLTVITLKSKRKEYIGDWIKKEKNPLVISGSFGRSGLSEFFRKSFVASIIKDALAPVFIAHR